MWIPGNHRAAESLPEFSDTTCFVPCKRCSELLQEDDRFCRFCGVDQFDTDRFNAEPVVGPPPDTSTVFAFGSPPVDVDFADTLQPEEPTAIVLHRATMLAANEAAKPDCVMELRTNTSGQRKVLEGSAPVQGTGSSMIAFRLAIGVLSLGVLLALALGRNLDLEKLWATADQQTQAALPRSDPSATNPALGVSSSVEALNRQVPLRKQEAQPVQADTRDQLREVASEVFRALGLGDPAAPTAQPDVSLRATMVADPSRASGAAVAKQDGCSEALVALAMCPTQ